MAVIFCYLKKNYKVLRFHMNKSSFFEIMVSLFLAPPFSKCLTLSSKLNNRPWRLLEQIRYTAFKLLAFNLFSIFIFSMISNFTLFTFALLD